MIDGLPVTLIADYQAHAAMGVVEWWLNESKSYSPAQTARLHMKLISGSLTINRI